MVALTWKDELEQGKAQIFFGDVGHFSLDCGIPYYKTPCGTHQDLTEQRLLELVKKDFPDAKLSREGYRMFIITNQKVKKNENL